MTEPYPLLSDDGAFLGALISGGDATRLHLKEGTVRTFVWISTTQAVEVTETARDELLAVGGVTVSLKSWLRSLPYLHVYAVEDVDEYAKWLAVRVRRQLEGRRVLLGLSGGKDSVAALVILLELMKYVNFKLKAMYVYIPFLEGERNLKFVEELSRKLSVDVDIVEAPRRDVRSLLKWKGLPKRGLRWCTYFKVKPMRAARKEDPKLIEVVADRLTEAPKRFERMKLLAAHRVILMGRKFRPTYILSLPDVINIVRSRELVHPDYLAGMPRVSCAYCPYKTLYELDPSLLNEVRVEDPGFIEEVLKKEHAKQYSSIPWEDFISMHLWRYKAKLARRLHKVYVQLRSMEHAEGMTLSQVASLYRRVWELGVRDARRLDDPWDFCEELFRALKSGSALVI